MKQGQGFVRRGVEVRTSSPTANQRRRQGAKGRPELRGVHAYLRARRQVGKCANQESDKPQSRHGAIRQEGNHASMANKKDKQATKTARRKRSHTGPWMTTDEPTGIPAQQPPWGEVAVPQDHEDRQGVSSRCHSPMAHGTRPASEPGIRGNLLSRRSAEEPRRTRRGPGRTRRGACSRSSSPGRRNVFDRHKTPPINRPFNIIYTFELTQFTAST
jgi:hypothetical protein